MKPPRQKSEDSHRKIDNVRVWIWTDSEQAQPAAEPVDPDQPRWSMTARVEGGRFHADLFSRQEGKSPVKFATLSMSVNAKKGRPVLEVFVDRADRVAVANGPEAQPRVQTVKSVIASAHVLVEGSARIPGETRFYGNQRAREKPA